MNFVSRLLVACLVLAFGASAALANSLRMATTTSTENSGLLDELIPVFENRYNIRVDVIAVGTGKALRLAENGDVDLLFVHAPEAEMDFLKKGFGIDRQPVMHNDFLIVGPPDDPANLKQVESIGEAFRAVALSSSTFISRGDDSGTHKKELALWQAAGVKPEGTWYLSIGQGMGAALRIANDKAGYTLSDRGTYLAFREKISLAPVFEGADELLNPYHIMAVSPKAHPHARYNLARQFIQFVTGLQGQEIIRNFRKQGEPLFYPDAVPATVE